MNIGIIGAGNIGGILARKLTHLGHAVLIANSRGPQSLDTLAADTGATAVSVRDVVKNVDLVVIAVPQKAIPQLPKGLFLDASESVITVETGNYYPSFRDGRIDALEAGLAESRWVAQQLGRQVVKAFNNITAQSLAEGGCPPGSPGRIALPVAGDDAHAKAVVIALVDALGFDAIDAGNLDDSWRQQPGTPVYGTDYDAEGVRQALTQANRARSAEMRELTLQKMHDLPQGFTHRDVINLLRLVQQA